MHKSSAARRLLLVWLSLLGVALIAGPAFAAGRVEWKSKTFKERSDKAWMLELKIFLPRAPDVAYVPMKFEFEPQVYYERALVDGQEGPVERKVPLEGRQPLIESVDVGFMDAGTSKIENRTRFSFKIKRDLGFEAGEYKVTIKDTRDGRTVGTPTTLTFAGENEIIDRRAMVFSGEKKKKPEEKKSDDGDDKSKSDGDDAEKSEDSSDDSAGEGSDDSEGSDNSGGDDPPSVEGKPGGCGCRVPGGTSPAGGPLTLLALLGLATAAAARRRR